MEYRALKANAGKFSQGILMNTPMNDTQVLMQGFDFDLRFLDTFVQSQVAQGKKSYDTTKRQVIGDF